MNLCLFRPSAELGEAFAQRGSLRIGKVSFQLSAPDPIAMSTTNTTFEPSFFSPQRVALSVLLLGVCGATLSCGESGDGTTEPSSGAQTGGAASGGAATGGGATGGASTGGNTSGGSASGGRAPGSGGMGGALAGTGGSEPDPVLDPDIVIDTQTRYQTIDGFGAALPMWVGSASGMLTTGEVQKLVGMGDTELGLSILRTIIDPDQNRWPYAVANLKEAKSYGAGVSVLASPWSPPAIMKDNNSTTGGGKLKLDYYDDYAAHLNGYVKYMAGQGVTIDVVSIQNEPDWHPDYDSCDWSGTELRNFVRDNAPAIVGPKILASESLRFDRAYTDPILNDATAVNNLDLVGGHLYGAEASGFFKEYPLAEQKNKGRWMTEWLTHEADGAGAAIWGGDNQAVWDETLDVVLRNVHTSMDVKWSAFIWWWGRRFYSLLGDGEQGTVKGTISKRGWAFSHYAKFVRPGSTRVLAEPKASFASLNMTAYEGDNQVVVVLLNRSTEQYDDVVFEVPENVASARAYVTSRTTNRSAVGVTPTGHYATVDTIAPRSVVTVVMKY